MISSVVLLFVGGSANECSRIKCIMEKIHVSFEV